jgi:hypothetical protein
LRNWRSVNRRSCSKVVMVRLCVTIWLPGRKSNSRTKGSRMQLYEKEAASGMLRVSGERIRCPVSAEAVRE